MRFKNKKVLGVMIVSFVVLATALSGCLGSGGNDNNTAPTGVGTVNKPVLGASEIKTKVLGALSEVKSYSVKTSMTTTMKDETSQTVSRIISDAMVDKITSKMFMNMTSETSGELTNMQIYVIGNITYMEMPGAGWVKLSAGDTGMTGAEVWQENDQNQKLQKLMEGSEIEYLGEETVSGVGCQKIKVTPSEKTLMDYLIGDLSAMSGAEDLSIAEFSVLMWVSKDKYAVMKENILMQINVKSANDTALTQISMDMTAVYDYAPVAIILPNDASNAKTMEEVMAEYYTALNETGYDETIGQDVCYCDRNETKCCISDSDCCTIGDVCDTDSGECIAP